LDLNRLQKMYAVGPRGLFFGIETGSERMQGVIKKNLDFERFEPILREGNRWGIRNTTAFILGFPEEEETDLDQTLLKALHYRRLGTPRVFFSKLTALTGTSIYRDYLDQLQELSQTSTTSPQNYAIPFVREIILSHPDLFSSFYHVPHPHFSSDFLVKFVEFANLTVNACASLVEKTLEATRSRPTELYRRWEAWARTQGIEYWDYHTYNTGQFREDFQHFLEAEFFSRLKSPEMFKAYDIRVLAHREVRVS